MMYIIESVLGCEFENGEFEEFERHPLFFGEEWNRAKVKFKTKEEAQRVIDAFITAGFNEKTFRWEIKEELVDYHPATTSELADLPF